MKTIQLTQGKVALVDDEDFDRINQSKWQAVKDRKGWYARRSIQTPSGRTSINMHREVLHFSSGDPEVDHRDHNGLDNRKENLRPATDAQQCMNRNGWSKIGFKGVHRLPNKSKPWQSRIHFNGKLINLGVFATPIEAARAYNAKALELFGQFARLNPV
jgi:hypothetical protein